MRRLLQLGGLLLPLVCLLVPISEAMDRWDAPGLSQDTEFRLFVIVLLFALVLLVARLVSVQRLIVTLMQLAALPAAEESSRTMGQAMRQELQPPRVAVPLRI